MKLPFSLAILALAASTSAGRAQEPVTFRPGQWGADFFIGGGFSGAGLIRFSGPARAWVLNGSASIAHQDDHPQSGNVSKSTGYSVALRLGRRRYARMSDRIYRTFTLGVEGSIGGAHSSQLGQTNRSSVLGGGVFADAGAQWLVTSTLSLGFGVSGSIGYSRVSSSASGFPSSHSNRINAGFGGVSLRGSFYF